jgi:hypothetical protein
MYVCIHTYIYGSGNVGYMWVELGHGCSGERWHGYWKQFSKVLHMVVFYSKYTLGH